MKLDRYSTPGKHKFRVFREAREGETPNAIGLIEVPAEDTFVLKRQDLNTGPALAAYSDGAKRSGDAELAADVERLRGEWKKKTHYLSDGKRPD